MGIREDSRVASLGHCQWVRGHDCTIAGKPGHECLGRIEAHHLQSYRAIEGGMGRKVGDDKAVPLCSAAHMSVHGLGQPQFEKAHKVDLEKIAAELWKRSPHRVKWERKQAE